MMHIHLPALSGIVLTYLLVFARVGAMMMLLPGIGTMGVPSRVRLVLALAVSFALTPTVQSAYPAVAPQTTMALAHPDRPGSHRRRAGGRHGRASS